MSNSLAIAAVTATLRDLLSQVAAPLGTDPDADSELADATCSTRPPDRARSSEDRNQLNLFLYQTSPNAALRNFDIPGQVRPNETAMTPLAVNLYYLLTAYGRNFDDVLSHRLLGRAMSILNDRAVLLPSEIDAGLAGNDLGRQTERVRVTPHALSSEEISKLWTVFQTPYRISAAYEVSVVLIDSNRRSRTPPPVIARGADGRGPVVRPNLLPPFPTLDAIALPLPGQPAARLPFVTGPPDNFNFAGDTLSFTGHDLAGASVKLLFTHPLFQKPLSRAPAGASDTGFTFALPDEPSNWPAGFYAVAASINTGRPHDTTTNSLALAIAPRLCSLTPNPAARDGSGKVKLTVKVSPEVWPQQRASLLVGATELLADSHLAGKTGTLTFTVKELDADTYPVRLRVDGVDSFLIDYGKTPLVYDPTMTVTLT